FTRGGARSRKLDDILREAHGLVARGHRELVLTGVNIGTYASEGYDLLRVIQALEQVDGLERLRISSIEPTTVPEAVVEWMATSSKLCPYLHVPVQSGDDQVLQRMKRHYTRAEFVAFVERVVTRVPDVCLGTDVMVGFPGEDARAFTNTRTLLADLPLAYCHVFSYSERPHTYAQRYTDTVPPPVIQERSRILRELSGRKKAAFYRQYTGRTLRVLFEQREDSGLYTGFSDNYIKVSVATHYQTHPALEPQDVYKLMYQAVFGPEHSMSNWRVAAGRLYLEVLHLPAGPATGPRLEPLSPLLCRVNLQPFVQQGGDVRRFW